MVNPRALCSAKCGLIASELTRGTAFEGMCTRCASKQRRENLTSSDLTSPFSSDRNPPRPADPGDIQCPECRCQPPQPSPAQPDPINPTYYQGDRVMCIIEEFGLDKSFCLGTVVKYILRAGKKGSRKEDLRRALWYLEREIAKGAD